MLLWTDVVAELALFATMDARCISCRCKALLPKTTRVVGWLAVRQQAEIQTLMKMVIGEGQGCAAPGPEVKFVHVTED